MLRHLINALFADAPHPAPLAAEDAEIAIAALLVRVARADGSYDEVEKARIDQIIARRRGLSSEGAALRRADAEAVETEAPDTVRFTRQVKDRIALEDRQGVIAALWEICLADGARDPDEEALIRLVSGLLGVTDRDSALMRQQVLDEMNG